jgi:hypothetical protein
MDDTHHIRKPHLLDPDYFVWYESNHEHLTEQYDEVYTNQLETLEDYRAWEEFVHKKYLKYKETIDGTTTI